MSSEPEVFCVSLDGTAGRLGSVRLKIGAFAVTVPIVAPGHAGPSTATRVDIIDPGAARKMEALARKAFAAEIAKQYGGTR